MTFDGVSLDGVLVLHRQVRNERILVVLDEPDALQATLHHRCSLLELFNFPVPCRSPFRHPHRVDSEQARIFVCLVEESKVRPFGKLTKIGLTTSSLSVTSFKNVFVLSFVMVGK